MRATTTISTLSFVTLLAAGLDAKTLEVPDDYPTITAAVTAAAAGDTIEIDSGTYFERVTIPAAKVGLKLEGKGSVIIDVHPSHVGYGYGVRIDAPSVTLENLIIRHARTLSGLTGFGVLGTNNVHGLTLSDVMVEDCASTAIYVIGNDVRIDDCVVRGNVDGIFVDGSGTRVTELVAYGSNVAINLHGPKARVEKCEISSCQIAMDLNAIDFGKVRFNEIRGCGVGVDAYGTSITVNDNDIRGFVGYAIHVEGTSASVTKNDVADGVGGAGGIDVYIAAGAKVRDNEIADVSGFGLRVRQSDNALVEDNEIRRCGNFGSPAGVDLISNFATIVHNEVFDTCGDGIRLNGSNNVIADNEVKNSTRDGIRTLGGTNNQVVDNDVQRNGGEGLCNSASNTTWRENSAKKNRIDLANDGTVSSTDNKYKSGGPATAPEIE